MTITTGIGEGPTPIPTGDFDFFTVPDQRIRVESFSCSNPTGATQVIVVFISPDATSAAGEQIGVVPLGANDDEDANFIVGQGYTAGNHIVLVPSATGMNATMTYTRFTGND